MKCCILIALLLVGTIAQEILVQSDNTTANIVAQAQDSTVPAAKASAQIADIAVDIAHLAADSIGDGSKWVYPVDTNGKAKILPYGWYVTYQTNVYTDCPQKNATLLIGGSSYFTIYLNGVVVGTGSGWGTIIKINLTLTCGCNNLTIVALNKFIRSPAGVVYSVVQNKAGCYDCKNLGITFYNRDTCSCECVNNCGCGYSQTWYDYPNCYCKCAKPVDCIKPKFYNYQTCDCECNKICCPANYYQDPTTCKCVRTHCSPPFVPCAPGTHQDPVSCACVNNCVQNVFCILGTKFNPVTCKCEGSIGIIPLTAATTKP